MTKLNHLETVRYGVLAGTAGGLAEIVWVTLYAGVTGGNAAVLARGVTTAAGLASLFPPLSAPLGIALHMMLAVSLGIALAFAWRGFSYRTQAISPFPLMLAALAAVWVVNFFVVLPTVSPSFVRLMPYSVSLISKMLFALAAAEVLRHQHVSMRQADEVGFAPSSS
jgi:hypothetical protein